MNLAQKLRSTPYLARVAPFIVFAALTSCQALFGEAGRYWFYAAKTLVGVWLLWAVWPVVPEMRWKFGWDAVAIGLLILVVWIALDPYYPKLGKAGPGWNPHAQFGEGSALAWAFIVMRFIGITLIVPPMEELFYRSFLTRYIVQNDFTSVPLNRFHRNAFVIGAVIFGFVHREWLAGILCGMAYHWLVLRHGRLGEAMTSHAITNFLLSLWVVTKGQWHFW